MTRGRLLKKTDQEKLNALSVEEYPWKDLSPESILLPDNPRRSVVLSKSHPKQELNRKVQRPAEFERAFSAPAKPLLPEDMTAEFLASQEELRQRKRRMQMDEDEAVALELLDLDTETDQDEGRSESEELDSPGEANADAAASVGKPGGHRAVGPDISDLSKLAAQGSRGFANTSLEFNGPQITQDELDARLHDAFEQGLKQGKAEGEKIAHEANTRLQQELAQIQASSENNAAESQPTFDEGMAAGIAQGRQEALAEAEEKFNHSLTLFTKALSELQHLKGELLVTGREIFAEIAQICAEKVLRTSVRLNDDALRNVFDAATGQFQAQDELRIEMHPEDISRIEAQIPAEQRTRIRLVANSKLERGDLKIDANNEVVTLDLHSTVQQVIDSLKDDIFETVRKDNSSDKAG